MEETQSSMSIQGSFHGYEKTLVSLSMRTCLTSQCGLISPEMLRTCITSQYDLISPEKLTKGIKVSKPKCHIYF